MTAGKVRAALIEKTGAIDVYFEDQVEILVANPEEFALDAVPDVFEAHELEFTEIEVTG